MSFETPSRVNIASYLPRAAAQRPDAWAVIAAQGRGWNRITFRDLDARSDRIARGLIGIGLQRGERTLVMVRPGVDLITLTYALFKVGAVPVLIDPGMGRGAFLRCVEQTGPSCFIGIPLAHLARRLFPSSFKTVIRSVTLGRRWFWGGATLSEIEALGAGPTTPILADTAAQDPAAILFTSGSTGPAKGALYTHGNFDAQVRALRADYAFAPGEVDLAAFPLFSLFDNALEMTSVIPAMDPSRPGQCDPAKIARALEEHACTTAFGSPAIWKRVAPWCAAQGKTFPMLRRILIAGASVPPALIANLHRCLGSGADVWTPYGATEALPVARIAGREILEETAAASNVGAGTCVGRPASGIEVALIRISDVPIAQWSDALRVDDGEVGELCVKGPVVTRAYANGPEATTLAKIADGEGIWHRMGDLASQDAEGRLWFAGRKAERVETRAGTLYTDQVEGIFAAYAGVGRCALVGVGERGSQRPVLVVEGRADAATRERVLARGIVEAVLFHPRFPVDVRHNAKIHRHVLRDWASARLVPRR
jgi:acyl-CoA synthetase (AMP-forming)/AMP-acid ligase II